MVTNHQNNNNHKNKRKLLLYQRLKSLKIKTNNQENCINNITPKNNSSKILPFQQHNNQIRKSLDKYFLNLRKLESKLIVYKLIVK